MKIAIHQPNFFPWSGYFYKIYLSDTFIFLDDVQYSKNSFTNRVNIISDKKSTWLTVPVKSKLGTKINDIKIADSLWKKKHLSKLVNAYKSSDFFYEVYAKICDLFEEISFMKLAEVNQFIILRIANWLKLEKNFHKSSELEINKSFKGDDRLIEIIKYFNCEIYYSGIGAKKYQDIEKFANSGIELKYLNYREKQYSQMSTKFIGGTSILDLLFNLGIKKTIEYCKCKHD
ncbi:MAG: hypothetical protein CMJ08_05610 [Pelagibacterales bacterium]|nr:hypothetical protein [Pelagibacterales bacterium]